MIKYRKDTRGDTLFVPSHFETEFIGRNKGYFHARKKGGKSHCDKDLYDYLHDVYSKGWGVGVGVVSSTVNIPVVFLISYSVKS